MTDLDQAHMAGFVEGTELVLAQLARCLLEHDPEDQVLLKLVRDQVALEVANRMEDEDDDPHVHSFTSGGLIPL